MQISCKISWTRFGEQQDRSTATQAHVTKLATDTQKKVALARKHLKGMNDQKRDREAATLAETADLADQLVPTARKRVRVLSARPALADLSNDVSN